MAIQITVNTAQIDLEGFMERRDIGSGKSIESYKFIDVVAAAERVAGAVYAEKPDKLVAILDALHAVEEAVRG